MIAPLTLETDGFVERKLKHFDFPFLGARPFLTQFAHCGAEYGEISVYPIAICALTVSLEPCHVTYLDTW